MNALVSTADVAKAIADAAPSKRGAHRTARDLRTGDAEKHGARDRRAGDHPSRERNQVTTASRWYLVEERREPAAHDEGRNPVAAPKDAVLHQGSEPQRHEERRRQDGLHERDGAQGRAPRPSRRTRARRIRARSATEAVEPGS